MYRRDILLSYKNKSKGYLVLVGGAEDKKDDKLVLKKIVGINRAKNAIIIPTASNYPSGLAEDYFFAFRDCGVENITVFDIRERSEADKSEYLEQIEQADLIFFTGGDQVKLVNTIDNTELIDRIRKRHLNGATIAGTSAGAAAASNPMIYDGDERGLEKGSINHGKGFGFIENVTIDTHFVNRGRLGRLTQFLCAGDHTKGIGIGEDTAIVISPSLQLEVVGSGMVTVVNTEALTFNDYHSVSEKAHLNINGIKVGFLQAGCVFDINTWDILSCNQQTKLSPDLTEKVRMFN